jgi:hypothetical protein
MTPPRSQLANARQETARALLSPSKDRRGPERFTLILRVGVLEQQGRPSLCLVRNISAAGAQLRIYAPPALDAGASIRIADEPPAPGRVAWIRDGIAGFRFEHSLDAATMFRVRNKLRPNHRRSVPRIRVDTTAVVRTGGRMCRALVCDISSLGARLCTRSPLLPGDRAEISLAGMPPLSAYVRWAHGAESGVAFETPVPIQIIAAWIEAVGKTT